jgi:hypothetical protein
VLNRSSGVAQKTEVQELQEYRSYRIDRMHFGPLGGREFFQFFFDSSRNFPFGVRRL